MKYQDQMDAATKSAREQIEVNKEMLTNNLDAADRIIMRKAAETTMELAKQSDPQ